MCILVYFVQYDELVDLSQYKLCTASLPQLGKCMHVYVHYMYTLIVQDNLSSRTKSPIIFSISVIISSNKYFL